MNCNPVKQCRGTSYLSGILVLLAGLWLGPVFAGESLRLTDNGSSLTIVAGPQVIARYRYGDVPFKPYFQVLSSPGGVNVLLDAPPDHLHHHGLMFAVKVDGINFWEEQEHPGRQQHRAFAETTAGKDNLKGAVSFVEQIDWMNTDGKEMLLKEQRKAEVEVVKNAEATVLFWVSRFQLPPGKQSAMLTGAHYHGLGMRFLEAMNAQGPFQNAEDLAGEVFRGDERLTPTSWCAYTAGINGKPVTVAMFGHPDNLRSPALWFTMAKPFAYLAATLNLHREPLEVTASRPLELRYCVAVWDGRIEKGRIEQVFRWWLGRSKGGNESLTTKSQNH
jgi:hypothetical protein